MVRQARQVTTSLLQQVEKSAQQLVEQVEPLLPLIERVIVQTRTRVLEGKQVAASDKVLSLFEPHTRIIPRHKGGAPVEFGRHVELDEVEGGIVTRFQILEHPDEHGQGLQALEHHRHLFGHPPGMLTGDRGVHSAETEVQALGAGVEIVAIPAVSKISPLRQAVERTRRWKKAYRWRAGIEGRIASLRRDYRLRRCDYHGPDGMERWIGFGIIGSRSAPYRPSPSHQSSEKANGLRRKRPIKGQKEQATSSKNQIACSRMASQANLYVLHRILVLTKSKENYQGLYWFNYKRYLPNW